ncbi:MAG: SDR family oxidoreductase [Actinomycetota bacterium]|nr:SDR family oxidoreductase [Actinomycetota bacterium]
MTPTEGATGAEFDGRIAIITGGGRGFGAAFGRAIAARGGHAILLDIDADAAEQAAARIRASGGQATGAACDVAREDDVQEVMDRVAEQFGGIDILINNAGLHSEAYSQPMAVMGLEMTRRLFEVNLMGVVICTMAARPAMAGRPGACVFNISSSAAYASGGAYGVSKLAVRGLTMAFARELGPDGIRVNAVAPGLHLTDTIRLELNPATLQAVKAQQILPLDGTEEDIVQAMLFLCSDRARFVTGETLRVSAGFALCV